MRYNSLMSTLVAAAITLTATSARAEVSEELLAELRPVVEMGLASDDVAVQSWAIRAAAMAGDGEYRTAIVDALQNTNAPVRIAAAQALIGLDYQVGAAETVLANEVMEGDAAARGLILNSILVHLGEGVREDVLDDVLAAVDSDKVLAFILGSWATLLTSTTEGAIGAEGAISQMANKKEPELEVRAGDTNYNRSRQ